MVLRCCSQSKYLSLNWRFSRPGGLYMEARDHNRIYQISTISSNLRLKNAQYRTLGTTQVQIMPPFIGLLLVVLNRHWRRQMWTRAWRTLIMQII